MDDFIAEVAATERALGASVLWVVFAREFPDAAADVASGAVPWLRRLVSMTHAGLERPDVYAAVLERLTGIPVDVEARISDLDALLLRTLNEKAWGLHGL